MFRHHVRRSLCRSLNISSRKCPNLLWRPTLHRCPRRLFSTPPPHLHVSNLSAERYHDLSEATMESMLSTLEDLLDTEHDQGYEIEYHSGVLTLSLGQHGTYVVNKQPPNKQIWLSSPVSGPKRYDYDPETDEWVYTRDGESMGQLLNDELSVVFRKQLDLGLRTISEIVP